MASHARPLIVHVITALGTGGAEAMLAKLMAARDPARFDHRVIALGHDGPPGDAIRAAGVPVLCLGMRSGLPDPLRFLRLVRLLRRWRPALVQTWLYHADLLGLLAAKLARVPHVAWNIRCADMDLARYGLATRLVVAVNRALSGWPDAVLVNSTAGRDYHTARLGFCPRQWILVPNGVDTARYRPDPAARVQLRRMLGVPDDTLLIGHAARFDPMKDHGTFLAALARMDGVHAVLCGRGVSADTPAFAALIAGRIGPSWTGPGWTGPSWTGRLHLLGERHDLDRILPGLDLFCLSSAFGEGSPNVLLEAMACGVPCVATDVGDAARLIGPAGRVVPPGDPARLAEALTAILTNPPSQSDCAAQVAAYALPAVAARHEDIWAGLIAGDGVDTLAPASNPPKMPKNSK